jgi:NADH dehydrogenase
MRWILVEARDRIMPEIPAPLADFATRELRGRGIAIRTSTTLDAVDQESATLSGGEVIPTRTLVWTAGVKPHPVIAQLGLPLDGGGRIKVDRTLRVEGHDAIWALGDAAAVPDPAKKGQQPTPPTAQHAIRQGKVAGRNVAAAIGSGKIRPFTFKTKGVFVDMGQGQAVATTLGIRWRGLLAWWLARSYHLAMLPGTKRKWRLLIDWNIQLIFGRDASELGGLGRAPGLGADLTGGATPAAAATGNGAQAAEHPVAGPTISGT